MGEAESHGIVVRDETETLLGETETFAAWWAGQVKIDRLILTSTSIHITHGRLGELGEWAFFYFQKYLSDPAQIFCRRTHVICQYYIGGTCVPMQCPSAAVLCWVQGCKRDIRVWGRDIWYSIWDQDVTKIGVETVSRSSWCRGQGITTNLFCIFTVWLVLLLLCHLILYKLLWSLNHCKWMPTSIVWIFQHFVR